MATSAIYEAAMNSPHPIRLDPQFDPLYQEQEHTPVQRLQPICDEIDHTHFSIRDLQGHIDQTNNDIDIPEDG